MIAAQRLQALTSKRHSVAVARRVVWLLLAGGLLALLWPRAARAADEVLTTLPPQRLALIVSASDGGPGRARLRFASSDAAAMAQVLQRLGGLSVAATKQLDEPTPAQLEASFAELAQRAEQQKTGAPVQFFFYYSGHSDETGLLLGAQRLEYTRLRALIKTVHADVHIGILDSCAAGALTLLKGGQHRAAFLSSPLATLSGHAFLTSTSEHEAAQESARIRGSFFTYFLLSGLRGAADINQDRRVTLQEAYRFAFEETLARTETTAGGSQHPAYDIELVGTGDLVLTTLNQPSTEVEIAPEVSGRLLLHDQMTQRSTELYKPPGSRALVLSLDVGVYRVTLDDGSQLWRGSLDLRSGRQQLNAGQLRPVPVEAVVRRGSWPEEELSIEDDPRYRLIKLNVGLFPYASINSIEQRRRVINRFSFSVLLAHAARIHGFDLSAGGSYISEAVTGVQLSLLASIIKGELSGVQGSLGLGLILGDGYGLQLAPVNLALHDFHGMQGSLGLNLVRGSSMGIQLSSINIALSEQVGLQAGLALNVSAHSRGVQLGSVNLTQQVTGAQLGAINVATGRVHGFQLGVINYAEEADVSIGLLTLTKKGGIHPSLWTSDVAAIHIGLFMPARFSYSFITAAVHPTGAGAAWMYGLGGGARIPLPLSAYLNLDGCISGVQYGFTELTAPSLLFTTRVLFGWQFAQHFALYAGPTFNALIGRPETPPEARPGYTDFAYKAPGGKLWPGFAAGLWF